MAKKAKLTEQDLMQIEFERERLERASGKMLADQLVSKGNKRQATYGHIKRKLEKVESKA